MDSIKFSVASVLSRINDRIQLAPQQVYASREKLWLVLWQDKLLCPTTGKQCHIDPGFSGLDEEGALEQLVAAARQLCDGDERPICLLLPLASFLYSHFSIQLGNEYLNDRGMVHSAISFQKDILLPAIDQEFALAAAVGRSDGVAFWFPQLQLESLETAFKSAGLELLGVAPRILAAAPASSMAQRVVIVDSDAANASIVEFEGTVVAQVLSASQQDFDNPDLRDAWNSKTAPLLEGPTVNMSSVDDWLRLGIDQAAISGLLFFTRDFLAAVGSKNQRKRVTAGALAAVAAMFLLAVPFIYQWVDAIRLENSLEAYRGEASVAESYQEEILDMEYEWGVVYEYPEADTAGILLALNSVITNSLTSFSLDDSVVEIQGSTQDPELLIRSLVEQPLFRNIEQSRSISDSRSGSGDRFGLRITLSGSDYEEYAGKYDFK